MEKQSLKVLVFGGTGSQAKPTVLHLLANGHHPYVFTRNPENAKDLEHKGAKIQVGDFDDSDSIKKAVVGKDAIAFLIPAFLSKPDEAKNYAIKTIDAVKQAGGKIFVWNLSGALQENDYRYAVIDYLKKVKLPYILFEPTTYMENWLGPWTAPYIKTQNKVAYPQLPVKKVGWIASDDMGKLVVSAIEHPELADQHFKVSGVEAPNGIELAEIFSEALHKPITYYSMPPDEMQSVLNQAFGPGAGASVVEMYRKEQNDPLQPGKYHDMNPVLAKLPVQMNTIKEWVTKHLQFFV